MGTGTAVNFTAASAVSVSGNVRIDAGTTFNGGSYMHTITGNWVNNGTFTGSTSTITFTADGAAISGNGTNSFNNLDFNASNITAATGLNFTVSGNLSTSGSGSFTHSGGTITFTGTGKSIVGTGISFDNLTVSGSLSTESSFAITGNLAVSNAFTSTGGTVTMPGKSKTISGNGIISFTGLAITGAITTNANISISGSIDVSGTFSASAGTTTFTNASTLNGTANLNNVTLNGTSLQLSTNAVLGIAGTYSVAAGSLNVTSTIPNTVNFNGSVAQNINGGTYHHLILSGGNTKTATGAVTANGDIALNSGTTFAAGSYTHTVYGNWNNNGSFTAGSGAIAFAGSAANNISGNTIFNILTINKSSATAQVRLQSNISTPVLNMTSGMMLTGINTVTITGSRTGNGIILGNIQRTHNFTTGTAYAFEGPQNTITFSGVSGVSSISVSVRSGSTGDFPNNGSINRVYNISIPSGSYTAVLRLHYEDNELNGNEEEAMMLWNYNASWTASGKSANSAAFNYVEKSDLTSLNGRWTLSDNANVVRWNGSVSSDWNTAANWTSTTGPSATPPTAIDIVEIGTAAFINQPVISTNATVKNITFGSAQAVTLTLAPGGSLISSGNINGSWNSNVTHTIQTGAQSLTINGDLQLGDGTAGHAIDLHIGSGSVNITGTLTQTSGANVVFSGNGTLYIGSDFDHSSGTLTPGNGTVIYNGSHTQHIAGIGYNHLHINKSGGIANITTGVTIAGNLAVNAGELNVDAATTVTGDVTIASDAIMDGANVTLLVGGNWENNGTFKASVGTITFNGTGTQSITASTFNNFTVNKPSGAASLTGNIRVNGNTTITAGTMDLATYTANRSSSGGTLTISNGAILKLAGAGNFPAGYAVNALATNSTVQYNGTTTQNIAGVAYGNLLINNGGSNNKTLAASTSVNGDLNIAAGAALNAGAYTLSLFGNWINNGTFIPSTGTLLLNGAGKTITGNSVFNRVTVYGSYTVANSDITFNGLMFITGTGSFSCGNGTMTVNGDLTNSGTLTSTGVTTFTGTTLQTIRLLGAMVTNSYGVINFNGNVSPVLNSTSAPTYANLNINNTAGINPSVNWTVLVSCTVGNGAAFNGGVSTHTMAGAFTNNGTVTSTGTLNFAPSSAVTVNLGSNFSSTGTVVFGGPGATTLAGTPTALKDVVIANTNSAGVTFPSDWTIGRNLTINSNATLNGGNRSITIAGNIESNGTLNGGTSTFIMSSANGQVSGSAATQFNHFTVAGTTTLNSDIQVAGNFSNNGVFDASIGSLVMNGTGAATIGGTTSPSPIGQLAITKSGNATVTLARNLTSVTNLDILNGMLDAGAYTITQDAGGGALTISNGGTLRIGGTNGLPAFSSNTFDTLSTVDYAGSTQTIAAATPYGNLTVSATGTKTPVAALTILNNFSLTNGTFTGGAYTHTVGGNWNMAGGVFTNTGTTILMNGTGTQDIYATGAFNNLTCNKLTGQVTQSSNVAVNGTLTFISGKISIGNYNLTIGSAGSIAGAASNTGYVIANGTGTLIQQVNSGSSKTYPVGTASYYSPATIALTASSTTDNLSVRVMNAVYINGTSGNPVTSGVVNNTWLISENTPGGSNATVTLQWPQSLELSGFSRTACRLAHFVSNAWDNGAANLSASGANPYTVNRSAFTSFSPFIVASDLSVLPVVWVSVRGQRENNANQIYWTVTNEYNNAYFSVEASTDGNNFHEIGKVTGRNNRMGTETYHFTDNNNTAVMYYRIKQVDIDGRHEYSKILRINNSASSMQVSYQNPVKQNATLTLEVDMSSQVIMTVMNTEGKQLLKKAALLQAGRNQVQLDLSRWPAGVYYCNIHNTQLGDQTLRLIKE
ncbi:T9SS type A sorting domain-containing protein [Niastella populi]|uniref:Secretion system C-terminal sorting domain-containing protein n=1 Tax=Niastella populi TaxID=550983 RepID=A0A1V9G1U1_9BACT|nr:T9SS type A sorting domain-containing protein [Niastella populi]OQP64527.1 hypothetical protein A4R26_15860 [Niastella populi]